MLCLKLLLTLPPLVMNSVMRSIELATYMCAPALIGQLFTMAGYVWTAAAIALWTLASLVVELGLLQLIYKYINYSYNSLQS